MTADTGMALLGFLIAIVGMLIAIGPIAIIAWLVIPAREHQIGG